MDFPVSVADKAGNNSEQTKTIIAEPNDAKLKTNTSETSHQQAKLDEISNEDEEESKRKLSYHDDNVDSQLPIKGSDCKQVVEKTDTNDGSNGKEKKRYEEVIIDGMAISAFETWQDLQDEANEQIAAKRSTSKCNDKVKAKRRSKPTHDNSLKIPAAALQANSKTTSSLAPSKDKKAPKVKMATKGGDPGDGNRSVGCKNKQPPHDNPRPTSPVDHMAQSETMRAKEEADKQYSSLHDRLKQDASKKKKTKHKERDGDEQRQHGIDGDQARQQQTHGSVREEFNTSMEYSSSTSTNQPNHSYQTHNGSPYQSQPVQRPTISHQNHFLPTSPYRNGFENKQGDLQQSSYHHQAPPPMHLQFSAITKDHHQSMSPSTAHYQQPAMTQSMMQMNNQYSPQQYFNSSQQLYQQHPRDSQQFYQQSQMPSMNHSYVPPYVHPAAPHCSSAMIAQSSLRASYNSPYTITDTIISRQTSIMPPPMGLHPLSGSRYGNYTQPSTQSPMGMLNQGPSYAPGAAEGSFMGYARNYTNANSMTNFMKSTPSSSSLAHFGIGNSSDSGGGGSFSGGGHMNLNFNRYDINSQRMSGGYNCQPPGLPDSMMSRFYPPCYNIDTKSAVNANAFYPPYPYR